jgi:hypothetical protein
MGPEMFHKVSVDKGMGDRDCIVLVLLVRNVKSKILVNKPKQGECTYED